MISDDRCCDCALFDALVEFLGHSESLSLLRLHGWEEILFFGDFPKLEWCGVMFLEVGRTFHTEHLGAITLCWKESLCIENRAMWYSSHTYYTRFPLVKL